MGDGRPKNLVSSSNLWRQREPTDVAVSESRVPVTDMLLGHASHKSWRHYVGFAPEFLHDAVKAIEADLVGKAKS